MGQKQIFVPCNKCGETRPHVADTPSHLLHLVLTLLTFGLWLIPWFIVANNKKPAHCTVCGNPRRYRAFKGYK